MEPTTPQSTPQSTTRDAYHPQVDSMPHSQKSFWQENKIMLKALLIVSLCLLLLIPQSMITNLIHDRRTHQSSVHEQLAAQIGKSQTVKGPMIMIPYTKTILESQTNKSKVVTDYLYLMPEQLKLKAQAPVNENHRIGIYKLPVYESEITAIGTFVNIPWQQSGLATESIQWQRAQLVLSLSDFKGLKAQPVLSWNGVNYKSVMGCLSDINVEQAVHIPINMNPTLAAGSNTFAMKILLRGSENLNFTPVANDNQIELQSNWRMPFATGDHPVNLNKDFATKGTVASWNILGINKSFPQVFKGENTPLNNERVGISFSRGVDTYDKSIRSIKYALLIIGLTFVISFFIEQLQKKRIHALQYALVGIALLVFYTLLLSISEYAGFNAAYAISAIAVTGLIAWYATGIYESKRLGIITAAFLIGIYGFLFILINITDGSLLLGSIGLFIIIAAAMYISRKIDWYKS